MCDKIAQTCDVSRQKKRSQRFPFTLVTKLQKTLKRHRKFLMNRNPLKPNQIYIIHTIHKSAWKRQLKKKKLEQRKRCVKCNCTLLTLLFVCYLFGIQSLRFPLPRWWCTSVHRIISHFAIQNNYITFQSICTAPGISYHIQTHV